MTEKDFEKLLEARTWWIHRVLNMKASEYAKEDRLYNFKRAAEISRTTPEKALYGMFLKHLVSVIDMIEGTLPITEYLVNEKIGYAINYLILLEAIFKEQLQTYGESYFPGSDGTVTYEKCANRFYPEYDKPDKDKTEKERAINNDPYKDGTWWKSGPYIILCDKGEGEDDSTFSGLVIATTDHSYFNVGFHDNTWIKKEFTQVYPEWKEEKA